MDNQVFPASAEGGTSVDKGLVYTTVFSSENGVKTCVTFWSVCLHENHIRGLKMRWSTLVALRTHRQLVARQRKCSLFKVWCVPAQTSPVHSTSQSLVALVSEVIASSAC